MCTLSGHHEWLKYQQKVAAVEKCLAQCRIAQVLKTMLESEKNIFWKLDKPHLHAPFPPTRRLPLGCPPLPPLPVTAVLGRTASLEGISFDLLSFTLIVPMVVLR